MKKLALIAALMLSCLAKSDARDVPGDMTNVFMGGVDYATSSFSAEIATVTVLFSTQTVDIRGIRTVYGVNFSTGNCGSGDYVDVWDVGSAASAVSLAIKPTLRLYNVNGSTNVSTGNASPCSGFSGPKYPLRFTQGLFWKPSVNTYNSIQLLYLRRETD